MLEISWRFYVSHNNYTILLEGHGPGGDRVLCKDYGCDLQETLRLIGRTTTMTS